MTTDSHGQRKPRRLSREVIYEKVTQAEQDKIWEDVRKEFPNDEMMQEIHFIRQVHYLQTKDLSMEERLRFFESSKN
ncbi:MAG: hypothetical protein J4F29_21035 [Candidatus Latescibacteria bacterium]|nr:hypothetical protein [Candidatus Latescibacterota bacterium]